MIDAPLSATLTQHRLAHRHSRQDRRWHWAFRIAVQTALGFISWRLITSANARDEGTLILVMSGMILTVMLLTALNVLSISLTREQIGLLLPLPISFESRWRMLILQQALKTNALTLAISTVAFFRVSWEWSIVFLLWLPSAWTLGSTLTLTLVWIFRASRMRWRAIVVLLAGISLCAATAFVLARHLTITRSPSPLLLVPDTLIVTGFSVGAGSRLLGRWYVSVSQHMIETPVRPFAFAPTLVAQLAGALASFRSPMIALPRKDLLTQTRDPFVLIRIIIVLGALPLSFAVMARLPGETTRQLVAFTIMITLYGIFEMTPSPFGSEGNRLLIALLTPVSPRLLLTGKVLTIVIPNLAQAWLVVLLLLIGHGMGLYVGLIAFALVTIGVIGTGILLTCLSVWDVDLHRRIEDSAQTLMAEHGPTGVWRLFALAATFSLAGTSSLVLLMWTGTLPILLFLGLNVGACGIACPLAVRKLAAIMLG